MGGSGRTAPSAASSPLLSVDEVAAYLGVGPVTVYRWCRQGRLPALKLGKAWRIRRGALEDFLRQGDQDRSLAGLLTPFLRVPDHVIAVGATAGLVRRLDAAFFQVAEAHDGLMVKSYRGETASVDTLRRVLRDEGVDVTALEAAGRFAFTAEGDPRRDRATALRDLLQRPQQTLQRVGRRAAGVQGSAPSRGRTTVAGQVASLGGPPWWPWPATALRGVASHSHRDR